MSPLLLRAGLRGLARHPWQAVLSVLGVAVGVAVVVSIDLANASARRAFDLSTEALAGRATHQVVGGPGGLPDRSFTDIATSDLIAEGVAAAPVVEGLGTALSAARAQERDRDGGRSGAGEDDAGGITVQVLGVDPFSEAPFRSYLAAFATQRTDAAGASRPLEIGPLVTRAGAVLATPATAAEIAGAGAGGEPLRPGDRFTLRVGGIDHPVELVGLLEPDDERSRRALRGLLVMDVSSAQEVLGRVGRLDRIDLILAPGGAPGGPPGDTSPADRLQSLLPPGAAVRPAGSRSDTFAQMTRAFRLNLGALSLLALVCGMFLIYNTMTFAVVRRRKLFGTLRALGVTRREVLGIILSEAAAVALLGTGLGLAAGVLLGRGLVRLVTRTINDLYFVLSVRELTVSPGSLALGALLGVGATLAAALVPAWEATSAPPQTVLTRSALESRARRGASRAVVAGLLLGAAGAGLLALPGLVPAFAGLFAVIVGCALLTPAATVLLMRLLGPPAGAAFGVLGRMAARGVVAALSRTGVAIAALAIAVSVTVGVGVMISSFRSTVVSWLDVTLGADVYVRPPGPGSRPGGAPIAPQALFRIASAPGVERVDRLRRVAAALTAETAAAAPDLPPEVALLALDLETRGRRGFRLKEGDPEAAWAAVEAGEAVMVSEPFSVLRGLGRGDRVALETPAGPRGFPVAGVFYDYGTDQGSVLLDLGLYRRLWRDDTVSALSIFAAPGVDPEELTAELRRRTAGTQELLVRSNRTLRRLSLEIFDRTFLITEVLRLLAGLVAFIGVLSALMALELERARELGVLRANGLTPGQVWQLVTSQTGLMGLAAGLLSLPLGVLLAAIMIHVINRRSFGWTLEMELAPGLLAGALVLSLAAALLAGLYPAWRMSKVSPAEALRQE